MSDGRTDPPEPTGPDHPGDAADSGAVDGATAPSEADEPRSGLRNPRATVRAMGAGALVLEAVVLLLAIQPIRVLGGDLSGIAVAVVIGLAVAAVALVGFLQHPVVWWLALVLQIAVAVTGVFQWALSIIGLMFGAVWLYILRVRRTILGGHRG